MEIRNYKTWSDFKETVILKKNLNLQCDIDTLPEGIQAYFISADEGSTKHCFSIIVGSAEAAEFEENYLDKCNYASGVFHAPFASDNMICFYDGIELTEITSDVFRIYYEIPADNLFLAGGSSGGENIGVGDWFKMFICDHNNLLDYGVDFPLKSWVRKKFLRQGTGGCECHTPYAGQPPRYFHVCIEYHKVGSIGQTNPKIWVQLDLHEKVI